MSECRPFLLCKQRGMKELDGLCCMHEELRTVLGMRDTEPWGRSDSAIPSVSSPSSSPPYSHSHDSPWSWDFWNELLFIVSHGIPTTSESVGMLLKPLLLEPTPWDSDIISLERDPSTGFYFFFKPLVDADVQVERQSSGFGDLLKVLLDHRPVGSELPSSPCWAPSCWALALPISGPGVFASIAPSTPWKPHSLTSSRNEFSPFNS